MEGVLLHELLSIQELVSSDWISPLAMADAWQKRLQKYD